MYILSTDHANPHIPSFSLLIFLMFMFIYVLLRLTNAVWSYLLELNVVGTDQKTMNPLSQVILVVNKSAVEGSVP